MKALVLTAYHRLEVLQVPEPSLGPEEVLVRVDCCGICGSDVHGLDGSTGRRRPPVIMGHEAAGVIAQIGPAVEGWSVGDRVTFDSTIWCGRCPMCRKGFWNLCDRRRVFGVSCEEYRQNGAFAEYVAVPQHILYRLPEGVTFQQAALVEPLAVAMHAASQIPIQLGDTAVIIGTGMVGLLAVQVLRQAGCSRIWAVDLDPGRLELACQLGAQVGFRPDEVDVAKEIRHRTGGRGADVVLEVVGLSQTVGLAVEIVRKGGAVSLVGNVSAEVSLPLQKVVTRQIRLQGVCASCGEYPICLDLIAQGRIRVEPLISVVAPLEEGPEWFGRLYRREPGLLKVLLRP
ncbi:MAG: galactitol-1-phosphate 5-dehydrogenase [Thermoguttaceae bacterium]|nr:galactitol-1-phosphate 5-dehydrogenase [Thermoguttaceae bacterium]MDW8037501.1 galactitol-1-phosphate 5-dehydrogenase [Thermoguttaceae bacterium]